MGMPAARYMRKSIFQGNVEMDRAGVIKETIRPIVHICSRYPLKRQKIAGDVYFDAGGEICVS